MEDDAFLEFVDYAISELSPEKEDCKSSCEIADGRRRPPWSWTVSRVLKTCLAYSSGVTPAIILSELFQAWSEQNRFLASRRSLWHELIPLEKRQRRSKLANTITIDAVYEKNFLSTNSILEALVLKVFVLPGTDIYMLKLGDFWSSYTIDLYLHRRYYNLVNPDNGILKEGREVFLTGCCLRTGSSHLRLLPTEFMLILLDEDKDEDAMLLGAQFCSDSFSSISADACKQGSSYSFYSRVKCIGPVEIQDKLGYVQRRQIMLEDSDGSSLKFVLWGDQILLGNLLSVGSMVALENPFLGSSSDHKLQGTGTGDIFLEFGSATQLYLVPFIQPEEQVLIASTQPRYQRSSTSTITDQSKNLSGSQVTLPLDSQGSFDFRNYPFRIFVINLQGKMTGFNLYGLVTDIQRDASSAEAVFLIMLEDPTGVVIVKLHFSRQWSLGRLNVGHTVYITGLTCCTTVGNPDLPEVSWQEKDSDTSFTDLSCLPAVLNSSCLHKLSLLSALSCKKNTTHICEVRLVKVDHRRLFSRYFHGVCGHLMKDSSDGSLQCSLCCCSCDHDLVRGFHLEVHLQDESETVLVFCAGQAAAELLQIYPDDFFELPEVDQAMYLCTLENESFLVALTNSNICSNQSSMSSGDESEAVWEIVRAQKCN